MHRFEDHTDPELVQACLDGEQNAWDALVHRYKNLVYSIPLRYGLTVTDVEDVFQVVWAQLFEHLGKLRNPERLGAWLVITTRRECWRVANKRKEIADDNVSESQEQWVAEQESTESIVESYEQHLLIRGALTKLGERCQRLIFLLFYDRKKPSYEMIAEELSIPIGAIGPNRARCLTRLRKSLESEL